MKFNILKKIGIGLTAVIAGLVISGGAASAIPYNGDQTVASPIPAFNVFTGTMPAPAPTDGEPDFLQSRVPAGGNLSEGTTPFTDVTSAACTDGQVLQLHVYVHNGASVDGNNNGTGPSVAHGTQVKVSLPTAEAASFKPTADISATNAATVTDNTTINCNGQTVKLQYIAGSASQFSNGSGVVALPDSIVTSGASIRSEQTPGDVWGCWNERVYVVLAVKVVVVPPTPVVVATCNLFTLDALDNRTVKVNTFTFTATNVSVTNVVLNWGDGNTTPFTDTTKVVGTSHHYANNGTFVANALMTFSNGASAGGPNTTCSQQVVFSSTTPPVITTVTPTPAPTTLVNTGPGSLLGIFAGVSAIGTVAYRYFLGRRLGSN